MDDWNYKGNHNRCYWPDLVPDPTNLSPQPWEHQEPIFVDPNSTSQVNLPFHEIWLPQVSLLTSLGVSGRQDLANCPKSYFQIILLLLNFSRFVCVFKFMEILKKALHRFMGWFILKETFKIVPFQPPAVDRDTLHQTWLLQAHPTWPWRLFLRNNEQPIQSGCFRHFCL